MKLKLKKKRIYNILLIVMVIMFLFGCSSVNAELSDDHVGVSGVWGSIITALDKVIEAILKYKMGAMMIPLTTLLVSLAVVVFLALYFVFCGAGVSIVTFPFPDQVIFNKLPMFDVNFINPYKAGAVGGGVNENLSSLVYQVQDTISSLYYSFYTVAISVFTIAALVMGIKLVISTIASEKAQYKEAVSKWLFGLVLVFTMHWILAGIFALNETVVNVASNAAKNAVSFKVSILQSIPLVGNMISGVVDSVAGIFSGFGLTPLTSEDLAVPIPGYMGFIIKYLLKAIGGDIIACVILYIVLGQTIAIIIAYLKRLFYCIILGVIAPVIVAADTVKKVLGQKSDILNKWFQNFTLTVFMQSFHAIFLLFILKFMSTLSNDGVQALIALVGSMALLKFEKLFKELFGMQDGMAGSIKGGAAKAFMAAKAVSGAAKNLSDNKGKEKAATDRINRLNKERSTLTGGSPNVNVNTTSHSNNTSNLTPGTTTDSGILIASDYAPISSQVPEAQRNTLNGTAGTNGGAGGVASAGAIEANTQAINNLVAAMTRKEQKEAAKDQKANEARIKEIDEELKDAYKQQKGAQLARIMAPAVGIASAGLGLGIFDETTEAMAFAGITASAGDKGFEKLGERGARNDINKLYERSVEEGRENIDLKVKADGLDEVVDKMKSLDGMKDITKNFFVKGTIDPIKKSGSQFKEITSLVRGKVDVNVDDVGDIE